MQDICIYDCIYATARVFINGTGKEGSRSKGIDTLWYGSLPAIAEKESC